MNHASILKARRALSNALEADTIDVDEVNRAVRLLDRELARNDLYADSGTEYVDVRLEGEVMATANYRPEDDKVVVSVFEPGGNAQKPLDRHELDVDGIVETERIDLTNIQ